MSEMHDSKDGGPNPHEYHPGNLKCRVCQEIASGRKELTTEGQLLAASLENKRLRDALEQVCNQTGWSDKAQKCFSSPDHSALAGLYLELREKAFIASQRLKLYTDRGDYDDRDLIDSLRDILKRIKEQG